jgi:hypothetical protein
MVSYPIHWTASREKCSKKFYLSLAPGFSLVIADKSEQQPFQRLFHRGKNR